LRFINSKLRRVLEGMQGDAKENLRIEAVVTQSRI
jgi:hypothetical protein